MFSRRRKLCVIRWLFACSKRGTRPPYVLGGGTVSYDQDIGNIVITFENTVYLLSACLLAIDLVAEAKNTLYVCHIWLNLRLHTSRQSPLR